MKKELLRYAPKFFGKEGYYHTVKERIMWELLQGRTIYPANPLRCFKETKFDDVKVIILGQDPYFNGTADGLAFSTFPHNGIPPSLGRIFKEYCTDLSLPCPKTGDLTDWTKRGILLMNTALTVEANKPGSHADIGWWYLSREVIYRLSDERDKMVFIMWGKHAKAYADCVDEKKHLVLTACHPSPLTGKEWAGNKHFSKTCDFLNVEREFWKLR